MLKSIDLFAGIGGIRIGFQNVGFEIIYSNDNDPYSKKTYDLNFSKSLRKKNHSLVLKNIEDVDISEIPKHDILLAGFPCQPFSIAGYRKGFHDDGRGNMFFEITRILSSKKPKVIFLENVKNLFSHDNGNTFSIVKETLNKLGYKIKYNVLNTLDYGNIPQNRERIYIVGFLDNSHFEKFEFPSKVELSEKLIKFFDKKVDDKYYYNDKPLFDKIKDSVINKNTVYQWRRIYVRENKNGVCPTLTANMGTGGHNVPIIKDDFGIRKLTPRECARLQGFSDSYKFPSDLPDSRIYKQIGNSVSIPVIQRIAENIKNVLV